MFNKKINLQQFDRIILKENDIKVIDSTLKKYIDNNEQLKSKVQEMPMKVSVNGLYVLEHEIEDIKDTHIRKYASLLDKAKVKNKGKIEEQLDVLYYYELGKNMKISQLSNNGEIQFTVILDEEANVMNIQAYHPLYKDEIVRENIEKIAKSMLAQILCFIQYSQLMAYLNEDSTIIKRQTHIKGYQPKKLTKKEREREARKRVSVSKPKINYDYNEAEREGLKRHYERVVESWEVEGHWRTYKSGKRVFVKGYKKGIGKVAKKGKDFTL